MNISELKQGNPSGERTSLELKTHELLRKLDIYYDWVDNDEVSSMEECAEWNIRKARSRDKKKYFFV